MYDLEIRTDSYLGKGWYIGLESRLDGQFGHKAVHTRNLIKMDNYSSLLKINIKELNYILEILKHNSEHKDFQIRVFEDEELIVGRHYIIKENRSITNILINVLDDIYNQLNKANKKVLSNEQMIYIIELIFRHLWENK